MTNHQLPAACNHLWPATNPSNRSNARSLILVTHNNLALTHLCLTSLFRNTSFPNYKLIVVDNYSMDDTPEYLTELAAHCPHLTLISNAQNQGFAPASNQGLAQATGSALILLNNDTLVTPGRFTRLVSHLADPTVGLVGPATNFAGNEARVKVRDTNWGGMESSA